METRAMASTASRVHSYPAHQRADRARRATVQQRRSDPFPCVGNWCRAITELCVGL